MKPVLFPAKSSILTETQHEGALKKIQYLEDDSRFKRQEQEDVQILEKPQFGKPLKSVENLPEGMMAHLEATLTPVNDPTMKVEWFCNGKPIPQGKSAVPPFIQFKFKFKLFKFKKFKFKLSA